MLRQYTFQQGNPRMRITGLMVVAVNMAKDLGPLTSIAGAVWDGAVGR